MTRFSECPACRYNWLEPGLILGVVLIRHRSRMCNMIGQPDAAAAAVQKGHKFGPRPDVSLRNRRTEHATTLLHG